MRIVARCCLGTALALTLLVAASAPVIATSPGVRPLVGAYYYLWNPENFAGGTLRAHLVPPQQPAGSLVNSQSPRTAARDITNARAAGISFFAIDWWPYDPGYSGADYRAADGAMKDFLAAPNIAQMKFAMFYETWNLGFDPGRESTPVDFQMELHFNADFASRTEHHRELVNSGLTMAIALGISVSDISQNAVANLGWDEVRLLAPVFVGDTLYGESIITHVRESQSRPYAGIVSCFTRALNQEGVEVLTYRRSVMIYKREPGSTARRFPAAARPILETVTHGDATRS